MKYVWTADVGDHVLSVHTTFEGAQLAVVDFLEEEYNLRTIHWVRREYYSEEFWEAVITTYGGYHNQIFGVTKWEVKK